MQHKDKICSQCKQEYFATTEFFHALRAAKSGLRAACKKCTALNNKLYWQTDSGKAVIKRYHQSELGKNTCMQGWKRRHSTIKGYLRCILKSMRQRCDNPNSAIYKHYGGRGIKCLFTSSNDFINYVINKLQVDPRGFDCDRIDNDGNYERGNIQFITHKENCQNKRRF